MGEKGEEVGEVDGDLGPRGLAASAGGEGAGFDDDVGPRGVGRRLEVEAKSDRWARPHLLRSAVEPVVVETRFGGVEQSSSIVVEVVLKVMRCGIVEAKEIEA
ncbi:hypothetical protein E2562_007079 [Oryza meyeriana var. granulata]|uniref:DUF834 domain-containing protein n=1 Tax=Oryza meyeriana var. granulata TaxID=110450 RepID=A0A6G1F4Q2_9ORYZ|nr:hypothetical protein E2562_007079 [Oryza meyeriana var. granulata]